MLHDIVESVSATDSVFESPAIQLSDITPSGGVPPPSISTKFSDCNRLVLALGASGERAHKTLAVRTIGGHWLKQWTVGGEGRGEQARLEPNADIAT